MSRALVILNGPADRMRAATWAHKLPPGTRIEFKAPKRTLPQNDLLWALLTDVSAQATWQGEKLSTFDWKDLFTAAVKMAAGVRAVPGLEGGLMLLGLHTSDMSKAELSDVIEYIYSWGADHGVTFRQGKEGGPAQEAPPAAA